MTLKELEKKVLELEKRLDLSEKKTPDYITLDIDKTLTSGTTTLTPETKTFLNYNLCQT